MSMTPRRPTAVSMETKVVAPRTLQGSAQARRARRAAIRSWRCWRAPACAPTCSPCWAACSASAAGLAFFEGGFRGGAALLVLAGVCDILDGELARASGTGHDLRRVPRLDARPRRPRRSCSSASPASTSVNLLELAHDPARVPRGAARAVSSPARGPSWRLVAHAGAGGLVSGFLHARAAEGLGLECKVGWFERPERMVRR